MTKKIVRPRRTYDMDKTFIFPLIHYSAPMKLRAYKVKVRKLGDGVSDLVVECTFRHFPAMEVYEWDTKNGGGKRRR